MSLVNAANINAAQPVSTASVFAANPGKGKSGFGDYLAAALATPVSQLSAAQTEPAAPFVKKSTLNTSAGSGMSIADYRPQASASSADDFYDQWLQDAKNSFNFSAAKTQGISQPGSASPLPESLSTYQGGWFSNNGVSTSGSESVGGNIGQFHFPHFVEKDGLIYAYFIDHNGSENDVGLAISQDGVNFDYQGKVLTKGEDYDALQASFPAVQYDEQSGLWHMLYEGKSAEGDINSVCLALSEDGINWQKQGPIINPGDAGELSAIDVGTPTMFKENGLWHVYFHTYAEDGRVRMGYASGADLRNLEVSQEPLLDVDDAGGFETATVGARSNIYKYGDYYYMAYEVEQAERYDHDTARWGTNLARSTRPDGGWEKMAGGPLIVQEGLGFGSDGPELLEQDGQLWLYYRTKSNGTERTEITGLDRELASLSARETLTQNKSRLYGQASYTQLSGLGASGYNLQSSGEDLSIKGFTRQNSRVWL